MQLTQKLLGYLYRSLDKSPDPTLALRLRYDGSLVWTVQDGVLTTAVSGGSGAALSLDLSAYTLANLVSFLAAQPGYTVVYANPDLGGLSARILIDGSGDQDASNGDWLMAYQSLLWVYLEPLAVELTRAKQQITEMLRQMNTKTAEGDWLDLLGSYYAVPRLPGESDDAYGPRIIIETLRPRSNNVALQKAIADFTGQSASVTDVVVYGPATPKYNAANTHNGVIKHNATATPIYGLFDVAVSYDLLSGDNLTDFRATVTALVGRLRAAGTQLRSVLLRSSALSDAATAPTDGGALAYAGTVTLTDTATAPTESSSVMAASLAVLTDTATAPTDTTGTSTIKPAYTYAGIRSHNGAVKYESGVPTVQDTAGNTLVNDILVPGQSSLPASITFTRNSVGTYFDAGGVLQTAPANVPRFTYAPVRAGQNLLSQSTPDTTLTLWSLGANAQRIGTVAAPDGGQAAVYSNKTGLGPGNVYAGTSGANSIAAVAGLTVTISVWARLVSGTVDSNHNIINAAIVKADGSTGRVRYNAASGNVTTDSGLPVSGTGGALTTSWQRFSVTFTHAGAGTSYWYVAENIGNDSQVAVWGAQIETGSAVSAYVPTTTGPVTTVRWDPAGLMVEESRTNLLTYSEQFDNAAWIKVGCAVAANTATAPDGALSMDKLVEDTATGNHRIDRTISSLAAGGNAFSVFVKAAERSKARLQWDGTVNSVVCNILVDFDLIAGTAATSQTSPANASATAATITSVGGGVYRVTLSGNWAAAPAGTSNVRVILLNGASSSYTGDGVSGLYVWGFQYEAGAFPTSYIPTTAAPVTRNSDIATVPVSSLPGWSGAEVTLVAEAQILSGTAGATILRLDDGTDSNVISAVRYGGYTNSNVYAVAGGVFTFDTYNNSTDANRFTLAMAATNGSMRAAVNGALSGGPTGAMAMPSGLTTLHLGHLGAGSNLLNGYLRRLAYVPRRLSDGELQTLTT